MEWQHSALMAQSCPCRSEQKDFNVLLIRFRGRPDTNLPPVPDFEIGNVFYPDMGAFCRVLKDKSAQTLRHGRTSSLDLNRDIKIPCMVRQCWHAGERDFGVRAQPAEHVRVRRSCAEVWFHQQIAAYAPDRRLLTF